ncbi:MAG: carbohydrate kinase family protein, partial [Bacteroidales bacterium]|nr:carbohydrate kinase family protein [Bacteroidales bacterium]
MRQGATPSTIVLSDPAFNSGHGERIFINNIGASWNFGPDELEEEFFNADIVVFGGTALVPGLHDGLTELLIRSKSAGSITVANTVYDFRNELENPGKPWPLGDDEGSYGHIDLLIMDKEEAMHLSGQKDLFEAGRFFMDRGVSSFMITNGTDDTRGYSDGKMFKSLPHTSYPVSANLINDLQNFQGGDTTGCGDNFVGG